MNEDEEDEGLEFVFDDSEMPVSNKYKGLESFKFGECSEKRISNKYDGLKSFKFGKQTQSIPKNVVHYESNKNDLGSCSLSSKLKNKRLVHSKFATEPKRSRNFCTNNAIKEKQLKNHVVDINFPSRSVELLNNPNNIHQKEIQSLMINNISVESFKPILMSLIRNFYPSKQPNSLKSFILEIFDKLVSKNPKIGIPVKLSEYEVAGAILYFANLKYGIKKISYNQIYNFFKPVLTISIDTFRKHSAEFYILLCQEYKIKFDELVLEKFNLILDNVQELNQEDKLAITEKSNEILKALLNPESEKKLKISSHTNPEMLASMILYLISRIKNEFSFLNSARIGKIIGIDRKKIVNNFHRSLKERYLDELKVNSDRIAFSRADFLKNLIEKYKVPDNCEKFAFCILDLLQDYRVGNYIDKTIAYTIIYVTSQVCEGFNIPLEQLSSQASGSETSIRGCVKLFIPYLIQFINDSEKTNNLENFKIDVLELKLLTYDNNFEKIRFCANFVIDKLEISLKRECSQFALDLIKSLTENNYQIQSKEIKSLAGKAIYLGINFFELQGKNNLYPYMEKIGILLNVHKDNIEKQGNKLKLHFQKRSLDLVQRYSKELLNSFSFSKPCGEKTDFIINLIYNKWRIKPNPTFNFTVSISPVSVYLASILTEEINECFEMKNFIKESRKIIPTLVISHFKAQLSNITNYLSNEDFLKNIAFIYKNDIFPLIRAKENISLNKAPLFLDIKKHTVFFYNLVVHRNYRYANKSIYYEDILSEMGFDLSSKNVSKYFPYIGMGVSPPKAARLKKIDNFVKLKEHIKLVISEQGFPLKITSIIVNERENGIIIPRISTYKIKGVRYSKRIEFEQKFVKNEIDFKNGGYTLEGGFIKKLDAQNIYSRFCNPKLYSEDKILGHGQPDHDTVLGTLLKYDENSIVTEMPIWRKYSTSYITGHIDMLEVENDIYRVVDYKPKSFFHSIPQLAAYALIVMKTFDIKIVRCVMFNRNSVWVFDPISTLKNVMVFLKSLHIEQFWFKYVTDLIKN